MNTFLFDLDGTLLPLDLEEFMAAYFKELCKKFSSYFDIRTFPKVVLASTEYMVTNQEKHKTNKECFFEDFQKRIDRNVEDLMPLFDEFYSLEFNNIINVAKPDPLVKKIIDVLKEKGYRLVIATNPLFPKDAIFHRIRWAGLDIDDFELITSYENMHSCKPNLDYYKEILSIINKNAKEVMMVGNDVQEDIVSKELGIRTFLIKDYLIDRKHPYYEPDFKGSLDDLYCFVNELPSV
ncbi:HAD family hydrolase [Brassicibacter mesophilus]|jgi:HAD superfamily hydrolase (TIGR01549 family)|uniref:HAD family hydrolase n=1 Tax=Brassicibacter mesophilus TaxID=745119 RepID=UPI003D235C00